MMKIEMRFRITVCPDAMNLGWARVAGIFENGFLRHVARETWSAWMGCFLGTDGKAVLGNFS